MNLPKTTSVVTAFALVLAAMLACTANATTYVWTGAGEDGNWTTSENWEPATGYPSATADTALFTNGTIAAVCFDESVTFGTLNVSNKNMRLTFTGGDGVTATCSTLMVGVQKSGDRAATETTLDGVDMYVKTSNVDFDSGMTLRLRNGATLSVPKLYLYPAAPYATATRLEILSGSQLTSRGNAYLTGESHIVISNGTFLCSGSFYIDCCASGVSTFGYLRFQGTHPVMRVAGADFATPGRGYLNAAGGDVIFEIPEGGYVEPPLQHNGTGVFMRKSSDSLSKTRFQVLPESPALLSREAMRQPLVSISQASAAMTSASLILLEKTLDPAACWLEKSADGRTIFYVHLDDDGLVTVTGSPWPLAGPDYSPLTGMAAGASATLTAPAVSTAFSGASCTGYRVYDVNPVTLARTEIDGSPFAGTTCTYTHAGGRREIEWQWSVPVANVAGSDGEALQAALDAYPYAIVNLAPGDYVRTGKSFFVTNAVILTGGSVDPWETKLRVTTGTGCMNAVVVSNAGAVVSRVLVSNNGSTDASSNHGLRLWDGLVTDCIVSNCNGVASSGTREDGGGVRISGGILRRTLVTKCHRSRYHGEGIYMTGGLVENCRVIGCGTPAAGYATYGGGIYMKGGTARNTLVANCGTATDGSGIYCSPDVYQTCRIQNCTVANCTIGKSATGAGLSAIGGTARRVDVDNTIVRGCENTAGELNVSKSYRSVFRHCDTSPVVTGYGNIDVDPDFAPDYSIGYSRCVDGGLWQARMVRETDLAGDPRVKGAMVDIGAYERDASTELFCSFTCSSDGAADLATLSLDASVSGAGDDIVYAWTVTDSLGNVATNASGAALSSFAPALGPGLYTVTLAIESGGRTATATVEAAVLVQTTEAWLNAAGSSRSPFTTLATGGTNINEVLSYVADGGVIHVADGIYEFDKRIYLASGRGITIRSLNGPAAAILKPVNLLGNNSDFGYNYGFSMYHLASSKARLEGLTLLGSGYGADRPSAEAFECYGPTLYIENSGAMVSNCVVRDCLGAERKVSGLGVRLVSGTLVDSAVMNCRIGIAISGTCPGVGIYNEGGLVDRCIVSNVWTTSSALNATNGVAIHQTAGDTRNTLVTGIRGTCYPAVAVKGGRFDNCTVTANSNLLTSASGLHTAGLFASGSATVRNNIVARNFSAAAGETNVLKIGSATLSHCLVSTPDFTGGDECIFADPLFRDFHGGDYTFRGSSPLRDAGVMLPWMENALDLAGAKRLVGKPDIGCYESQAQPATVIQLR